jgi:hypothetical protein
MILGMGIGGLFIPLLGIIGFFMGKGDLKKMDQGLMDPSGRGTTKTGVVLGCISLVLAILYFFAIMAG